MKFWALLFIVLSLTACKLGIEDENEGEAENIVRSYDGEVSDFDNDDDLYNFTLTGGGNVLDMKGDIQDMVISGDENVIKIMEDTNISELTIAGDGNQFKFSSEISLRVETINVSGADNTISVTEYGSAAFSTANGNTVNGTQAAAQP